MTNELFQLEQIERLAQPNVEKTEEEKRVRESLCVTASYVRAQGTKSTVAMKTEI